MVGTPPPNPLMAYGRPKAITHPRLALPPPSLTTSRGCVKRYSHTTLIRVYILPAYSAGQDIRQRSKSSPASCWPATCRLRRTSPGLRPDFKDEEPPATPPEDFSVRRGCSGVDQSRPVAQHTPYWTISSHLVPEPQRT